MESARGPENPKCVCLKNSSTYVSGKKFPKKFISSKQTGKDGYPTYERRKQEEEHIHKIELSLNMNPWLFLIVLFYRKYPTHTSV